MICWLNGDKPLDSVTEFYVWRKQECSKRQLHMQNFSKGGLRRKQGGTTNPDSMLRKGNIIKYKDIVGYVGGWTRGNQLISLVNSLGKRVKQVASSKVEFLNKAPNILTEKIFLPRQGSLVRSGNGMMYNEII